MADHIAGAQGRETPGRRRFGRGAAALPDRYILLFAMLVFDLVIFISVPPGRIGTLVHVILVDTTLLLALRTSRARRRTIRMGLGAAAISVALAVSNLFVDAEWLTSWTYIMMSALLFATPVAIGRRILRHPRVDLRTIFGAVSIYVLIGMVFAFLYLGVNGVQRSPFFAQGPSDSPADYLYFSFITMTTVGFGDLTPATPFDRSLVVLEALLGQVFLVTTVARLVSLYGVGAGGGGTEDDRAGAAGGTGEGGTPPS